ncbi:hypothetical protein DUNSADRAFT_12818 [Dunaliella salina]|uniref:Encoded protein n=1 Tax=Dunaliella salina TaxID=3046 RepID=A0ABQ7H9M4_DUNSA|nr:hypothetical protein DUNSADRAFT_12818 [Dunaliella salina]|eukprot:KAF5843556.1 hypothetical protein DUNSADRAFT_12818 [Dunaliella salina]
MVDFPPPFFSLTFTPLPFSYLLKLYGQAQGTKATAALVAGAPSQLAEGQTQAQPLAVPAASANEPSTGISAFCLYEETNSMAHRSEMVLPIFTTCTSVFFTSCVKYTF